MFWFWAFLGGVGAGVTGDPMALLAGVCVGGFLALCQALGVKW